MNADVGKLGLVFVVTVGLMILVGTGSIEWTEASGPLGLIVGFLIGNGRAAVRNESPTPVIMRRPHDDEVITIDGPYPAQSVSKEGVSDGS